MNEKILIASLATESETQRSPEDLKWKNCISLDDSSISPWKSNINSVDILYHNKQKSEDFPLKPIDKPLISLAAANFKKEESNRKSPGPQIAPAGFNVSRHGSTTRRSLEPQIIIQPHLTLQDHSKKLLENRPSAISPEKEDEQTVKIRRILENAQIVHENAKSKESEPNSPKNFPTVRELPTFAVKNSKAESINQVNRSSSTNRAANMLQSAKNKNIESKSAKPAEFVKNRVQPHHESHESDTFVSLFSWLSNNTNKLPPLQKSQTIQSCIKYFDTNYNRPSVIMKNHMDFQKTMRSNSNKRSIVSTKDVARHFTQQRKKEKSRLIKIIE
ncbi:unnamed protein product [Blepharisma stoltei]|uniref:Uncharacterized protein n=1 Tax=Blepharisma stoltei TaxID=1481888 RepID=A0AAU9INC6_9CILI|nr:unnamed protein product [Blepharisma stoltei]